MKKLMVMTALCGTLLVPAAFAEKGSMILVAPTRLVFAPNMRNDEVNITNVTDKHLRYTVQLVDQTMNVSGTTDSTSGTFVYSAKPMLRYMPRVVDLAPGKRQVIRVLVTRPEGLADGDYHTHMLFDEIVEPAEAPSDTAPKDSGFSVQVGMSYSIGIPLVVQNGVISSSVTLVSATLAHDKEGKTTGVRATFTRTGNAEGNLKVRGLMGDKDAFTPRNLRVYREADTVEELFTLNADALEKNPQELVIKVYPMESDGKAPALKELLAK